MIHLVYIYIYIVQCCLATDCLKTQIKEVASFFLTRTAVFSEEKAFFLYVRGNKMWKILKMALAAQQQVQ